MPEKSPMAMKDSSVPSKMSPPMDRFPETAKEADQVEHLLDKSMRNLSLDEQERISFNFHGFTEVLEDQNLVEKSLAELEAELLQIDTKEKESYLLALSMNEAYVCSRHLRLMFLRHSEFDVQAAARMILRHFKGKREYFGDGEILARDVRQSDLSPGDLSVLESGTYRILPTPDLAGRTVVIATTPADSLTTDLYEVGSNQRAMWYMAMKALQDEGAQTNGIIWAYIMGAKCGKIKVEHLQASNRVREVLPYKRLAAHFCYSNPALRPYMVGLQLHSSEEQRKYIRIHFGTHEELIFKLQTFGINAQEIGFEVDGTLNLSEHVKWLEAIKLQEIHEATTQQQPDEGIIIVPSRNDVLFGKTKLARNNPGTVRALFLVDKMFDEYERLDKPEKTAIAEQIIGEIQKSGGKFLRQANCGLWERVDHKEARRKVAHWFRHRRFQRTPASGDGATGNGSTLGPSPNAQLRLERPAAMKRVSPLEDEDDPRSQQRHPFIVSDDFDIEPRALGTNGTFEGFLW